MSPTSDQYSLFGGCINLLKPETRFTVVGEETPSETLTQIGVPVAKLLVHMGHFTVVLKTCDFEHT